MRMQDNAHKTMTSESHTDLYNRADITICEALLFIRRRQVDARLRGHTDSVTLQLHIHTLEMSIDSLDAIESSEVRRGYILDIQELLSEIDVFSKSCETRE